ncbi:CPBP family intramembrane glutamic endopeptidase [Undibacterium terreum]|uniref:CAAX prenyl protease 2/Lysostaphin resistance protein A-like domain-containing protein n=1 Tax=Undibacterium terreum TaxID=1224302 RepID=A0A916U8G3_9BURK|nr:CPBP family intramembrane glutamic endopeptidase [Undibacterium terreum]GGC63616.1 hypothetical protein GCM10011396_08240 [Undibacterium terreum]
MNANFAYAYLMKQTQAVSATPLEAFGIVALCFGWFIADSLAAFSMAADSIGVNSGSVSGFSDDSFMWTIIIELALGALALLVLNMRGYSLAKLWPVPDWKGCVAGGVLYLIATVGSGFIAAAFATGQPAQPIAQIMAESSPSLAYIIAVAMVNGLYEELFLLGYLQQGFTLSNPSFAVGISVLVRLSYHLYQGPVGVLSVAVYGLIVGIFYFRTGRLWPAVFAHILADIVPFVFNGH